MKTLTFCFGSLVLIGGAFLLESTSQATGTCPVGPDQGFINGYSAGLQDQATE